jgi:hypothetical protein
MPVIGDIFHDGVTGTTVRAIYEWVLVTPVPGTKELSKAIVTNGNIRGNKG